MSLNEGTEEESLGLLKVAMLCANKLPGNNDAILEQLVSALEKISAILRKLRDSKQYERLARLVERMKFTDRDGRYVALAVSELAVETRDYETAISMCEVRSPT